MAELHNNLRVVRAISPISLGATASGGKTSVVVDRNGFETVEFEFSYGAVTATNATVLPIVKEGDVTGTLTSIADSSLIGTELAASLKAGTPRTSGVLNTGKNFTARLGYIGAKRYVGVVMPPTISGGIVAGCNVILSGRARSRPPPDRLGARGSSRAVAASPHPNRRRGRPRHSSTRGPRCPNLPRSSRRPASHVAILGLGPSVYRYMDLARRVGGRAPGRRGLGHQRPGRRLRLRPRLPHGRRADPGGPRRGPARQQHRRHAGLDEDPPRPDLHQPPAPGLSGPGASSRSQDVLNDLRDPYFNGTAPTPRPWRSTSEAATISFWGCDYTYANAHHAEKGRACLEFWIGQARARGIGVEINETSSLMDSCEGMPLYGYGAMGSGRGDRRRDAPAACQGPLHRARDAADRGRDRGRLRPHQTPLAACSRRRKPS
jgi:hypothetical protein